MRVTYEYIKGLTPSEIGKMSKSQSVDLLRKMRTKFQTRNKQLEKAGGIVYSPALEKMDAYYEDGRKSLSKITMNQAKSEIFQLQDFFKAETSTVAGARKVMKEQDARIFGTTPKGTPKKRMTVEQRTKFWSFYKEFLNTYKTAEYIYGSNKIQQFLGDMFIKSKRGNCSSTELSEENFNSLLSSLQLSIEEQEEYEYGDNDVFSGNWNDNSR